jgi:hypothetical protein
MERCCLCLSLRMGFDEAGSAFVSAVWPATGMACHEMSEARFSSDVSHSPVQCVTRHSRNVLRSFGGKVFRSFCGSVLRSFSRKRASLILRKRASFI